MPLSLLSLNLFWIPLFIAWREEGCGFYVKAIAFLLSIGYFNFFIKTRTNGPLVFIMASLDRALPIFVFFFFAFHSFSVSLLWLVSLVCMVATISLVFVPRFPGQTKQALIYFCTAIAMVCSLYACKNNTMCEYCGAPFQFRMQIHPDKGRYIPYQH